MAMYVFSNQRSLGDYDHKPTDNTVQQELQSLHVWAYLKIIDLHFLSYILFHINAPEDESPDCKMAGESRLQKLRISQALSCPQLSE